MKKLFLLIFLFSSFPGLGQNKLTELFEIKAGHNYPENMPNVQKWVEAILTPLFISSLQTSDSQNGDSRYLSFWLIGNPSLDFILPNTNGLKMQFNPIKNAPNIRSQNFGIEYQHSIIAYKPDFNPSDWHSTPADYFSAAVQILKLSDQEVVAQVLKNSVQLAVENKSKAQQLIYDINKSQKTKFTFPDNEGLVELTSNLKKYFSSRLIAVIYQTYIHVENNPEKTLENLDNFFAFTTFFQDGVIATIDALLSPAVKTSLAIAENIEFPATLLSPVVGAKSPKNFIRFEYRQMESLLDYKNRKLELTFTGQLNQKAQLKSGKMLQHNHHTHTMEWVEPDTKTKQSVDFKELKITVSEENVTVEALTPDENRIELVRKPWPETQTH